MPRLMRLYVRQSLCGFGISAVFTGMLLWFNIGNLGYLAANTDAGPWAVGIFWLLNGFVFGAVQFGICLMTLPDEDGASGGGRRARVVIDRDTPLPRIDRSRLNRIMA